MHVLMIVPKYPFPVVGGLERQAHELSKSLLTCGHSVTVLSTEFDDDQKQSEQIDGVHVIRIPWYESKLRRFLVMPWRLFTTMVRLRRSVRVVHVHNITWFGACTTVIAKLLGLPVIAKLPSYGRHGIPGERGRRFGWLRIKLLRLCDIIVAMSAESMDDLKGMHFPLPRVLKTTNGISVICRPPSVKPRNDARCLRVVFVGRLSVEKGLVDLLHVWSTLREYDAPVAVLRIIGGGPLSDELARLAAELGISETIEFTGYIHDIPPELARADVFVLPSYAEGNSNSVLEAMREGVPIVATAVGGTPLQVGAEGSRFLFPPGDRATMESALLTLMRDKRLRDNVGRAMRLRAEELFSMERIAQNYVTAYELLVSSNRDKIGELNAEFFSNGSHT